MVLEHLFPEDWLERKFRYGFILAFVYSLVAIVIARFLFGANSGIVAVVFISIMLLPYIERLFEKEEVAELHEKGGFRIHRFIIDNLPAVKVYATLFLGTYLAFMLYTFILPFFGVNVGTIFPEQLAFEHGVVGNAFNTGMFLSTFMNNWWVLLACFFLALLTGDGAIFFITWNASVWGAIFGFRSVAAAVAGVGNPFMNLVLIVAITLPHVIFEGGAYVLAAISGSIISEEVITKTGEMPRFIGYLVLGILSYIIGAYLISIVLPWPLFRALTHIGLILGIMALLAHAFEDATHRRVFWYNERLFIIGVILFFIGAVVETFVLGTSSTLGMIYAAAGGFL